MPENNTPPSAPQGPQMPPIDPKALIDTAIAVIKNPTEFFKGIKAETGFQKCLVFSVAMGVVYGVLAFVVTLIRFSMIMGFGFAFGSAIGALIGGAIAGILGPFIGGLIIWGISLAFGSKATWEPSVRIAAYAMALAPVNAAVSFIGLVPYIGWVSILVSLAVGVYGIYICVMGAKVLNFEPAPSAPATPPTSPPAQ
jgi:hypothetical protein